MPVQVAGRPVARTPQMKRAGWILAAIAIAAVAPCSALAQTWPSNPIRAVLPRVVFDQAGKQLSSVSCSAR